MDKFYLERQRLFDFFDYINEEYLLYVPVKIEGRSLGCDYGLTLPCQDYTLKSYPLAKETEITYNSYRTIEPIKSFLIHPREKISTYFQREDLTSENKRVAIFGVKNCDLFSLKIQDFVFLEETKVDSIYKERRENLLIMSSDCLGFKEVCFCLAYNINPYPEKDFDLNFSLIDEGFVVEIGSKKGERILEFTKSYFELATRDQIKEFSLKRETLIKNLKEHLKSHQIPDKDILQKIIKNNYESNIWFEKVLNCVECGGCNFICPTCHCFLLSDERYGFANERIRIWDSCQYVNFARVAGGANPLDTRDKRLRNRFLKKFDFFGENLGVQGCSGCGRCIEVCPGKIDIREILRKLGELES